MTYGSNDDRPRSELEDLLLPIDIEDADPDSAIVYRMLYEHSQAALAYTQTLYDLSRRLVGAYHLTDVLNLLCEGVKTALHTDAVFVVLGETYQQLAQGVWSDEGHRGWLPKNRESDSTHQLWRSGLIQRVLRTGAPVVLAKEDVDLRESPRLRILRKRMFGLCAISVTPMFFRQHVVGVVVAVNQYPKRDFNSFDVELITTFANQAALGIENARLQSEMAARSVQLAQQAEELARSNADLERFAYVASHDLQEPLRVVSNFVELYLRRFGEQLPEEGALYLQHAVEGTERMRQLISDLLAYSRIGTRGRTPACMDSARAFQSAVARLSRLIAERSAVITHDPLPEVFADESQIEQIFQNLLSNALKFRRADPPRVHVGVQAQDNYWRFSVQDNGIGIDATQTDRIFNVFQRLHTNEEYPGTGIGLAICKRIVERHSGRIWLESTLGEGSTFFFTLPGIE
ncbi:MAG: GAF domain-containing protein [Caldilineaceae bacterium]|nr:GAF domain-containing protein [Caldilineaceae bacterium]